MNEMVIFTSGLHTDNKGNQREYTDADLDKTVQLYDSKKHEAPLVIGHPTDNAPAYGWIDKLKRVGKELIAIPKQVNEDFKKMIQDGAFKKRSASFYSDGSLRHVGFLGAMPPAIKGMPDFAFNEVKEFSEFEFDNFSEDKEESFIKKIVNALTPYFKSKNQDNIDKAVNNYNEDEKMEQEKINELTAKVETLTKDVASFSEKIVEKDKTIQELKATIQKTKDESLIAGFSEFCESLVKEGRMKPADKDKHIKSLTNLSKVANFSEGEDNPIENYKEVLKNSPVIMDFSESQLPSFDASMDAKTIYNKAVEYSQSHNGVTVIDAINIVTNTMKG